MSRVSRRRLAQTVVRLLREQPEQREHIIDMTAAYLIAHKQQKQSELLLRDIAGELAVDIGHLYAQVTTPFPLTPEARLGLERYLQKTTGAAKVELDMHTEETLLSGLIVQTPTQELDTSARSKLSRLSSLNINTAEKA